MARDVERDRSGTTRPLAVEFGGHVVHLGEHIAEYDLSPLVDEQPRLGRALAPRSSGDECDLACQSIGHDDHPSSTLLGLRSAAAW